jgi:hypothetical protein
MAAHALARKPEHVLERRVPVREDAARRREEIAAHRRRAASSYEEGRQLLLALGAGDHLSSDDAAFLEEIRSQLTAAGPMR